jgi:hypothetical protein
MWLLKLTERINAWAKDYSATGHSEAHQRLYTDTLFDLDMSGLDRSTDTSRKKTLGTGRYLI